MIPTRRLVLLIALAAIGAPSLSEAGLRKCASRTITAPDARNAIIAAQRAAKPSKVIPSSITVCMNPDESLAWYEAEPEPQFDGSLIDHSIECTRSRTPWKCEVSASRRASVDLPMGNARKTVNFNLPMDLDIDKARHFVARAMELGPTLESAQECGPGWNAPDTPRGRENLEEIRGVFTVNPGSNWATVEQEAGGAISVSIFTEAIFELRFIPPDDGGEWQFNCWLIDIVVT